jgi:hypothetical protein
VIGTQAILMAKRAGKSLDAALIEEQFARFRDDLVRHEKRYAQAALNRVASTRSGKPSEDRAYTIAGATLPVTGLDGLSADRFENLARVLANLQFEDGRWIHGMARFPIESSDLLTTAEAIRQLRHELGRDVASLLTYIQWRDLTDNAIEKLSTYTASLTRRDPAPDPVPPPADAAGLFDATPYRTHGGLR